MTEEKETPRWRLRNKTVKAGKAQKVYLSDEARQLLEDEAERQQWSLSVTLDALIKKHLPPRIRKPAAPVPFLPPSTGNKEMIRLLEETKQAVTQATGVPANLLKKGFDFDRD